MTDLLTQPEVRKLCRRVGFPKKAALIASAIALCEAPRRNDAGELCSDFGAIGDQALANAKWGYSYGGFQVRSLREQKGTGGFRDEDRLLDPKFNAASALQIRFTSGFKAWSTYTSGAYKAYLPELFPPSPGTHVVVFGETLSGIGAALGIDWTEIARINNIKEPYVINIGQVLELP